MVTLLLQQGLSQDRQLKEMCEAQLEPVLVFPAAPSKLLS